MIRELSAISAEQMLSISNSSPTSCKGNTSKHLDKIYIRIPDCDNILCRNLVVLLRAVYC